MNYRNRDQYKRLLRVAAAGVIIILECLMFSVIWNRYYSAGLWIEPFWNKGNTVIVIVYGLFLLFFMWIYGGIKIGYLKRGNVIYSQVLSCICTNLLMYVQIILLWRRLPELLPMVFLTAADLAVSAVFSFGFDRFFLHIFPPRRLLLIYEDYSMDSLCFKIDQRPEKFVIVEKLHAGMGEEQICRQIDLLGHDGVILGDLHSELRNRLLKYCYARSIRVYMTPKLSDIMLRKAESLHMFDTPLLLARNSGLTVDQRFFKRMLDLTVSIVLLIPALPIMLVTAAAIYGYDRGPVFFKQKRLTIDGREFEVYKFRSMIINAEKDGIARLAGEHDSRITPVGRMIRACRIDELPQLFNVLKGEMSLVGPRPERPEIAREYEKTIPEFGYRLKVKAGLTGYAQVYGKYNTTAYDKLRLDLMYIENYSLFLDIKLIVGTLKILFMKESTEGVETGQTISVTRENSEEEAGGKNG